MDHRFAAGAVKIAARIRLRAEHTRACTLIATWSLTWICLASMSGTKLPHYIAAAFPALAVIAGLWIADWILARKSAVAQCRRRQFEVATSFGGTRLGRSPAQLGLLHRGDARRMHVHRHAGRGSSLCPQHAKFQLARLDRPVRGNCRMAVSSLAKAGCGSDFDSRHARPVVRLRVWHRGGSVQRATNEHSDAQFDPPDRRPNRPISALAACSCQGLFFYSDFDHPIVQVKKLEEARDLFNSPGRSVLITDVDGYEELGPWVPEEAQVVERQNRYLKGTRLLLVESEHFPSSDDTPPPATATSAAAMNLK